MTAAGIGSFPKASFALPESLPRVDSRAVFFSTLAVCAALTTIPALRFGGSLALRSISLITSGGNLAIALKVEGTANKLSQTAKVAAVSFGLIAFVSGSYVLMVASVTGDIALHTFETMRAFSNHQFEDGFNHLSIVVVNSLALTGLLSGNVGFLIAASAINSLCMFRLAVIAAEKSASNEQPYRLIESMSFAVLGLTGAVNTGVATKWALGTQPSPSLKIGMAHRNSSPPTTYAFDVPSHSIANPTRPITHLPMPDVVGDISPNTDKK